MIQRRDRPCFALESLAEFLVRGLDRNRPTQPGIHRTEHLAHATCAERPFDLVGSELRSRRKYRHSRIRSRQPRRTRPRRLVQSAGLRRGLRQQRLHLTPQFGIGLGEKRPALGGPKLQGRLVEFLDLPPAARGSWCRCFALGNSASHLVITVMGPADFVRAETSSDRERHAPWNNSTPLVISP